MNSLFYSYDLNVDKAYIIRLSNNVTSLTMANRCAESCDNVGQQYVFWEAYDGTGDSIITPHHHNIVMDLLKITNHYLTRSEVAAALSHISLWVHCIKIDKPIIILEHDAIMLYAYTMHQMINSIAYLGSYEQFKQNWGVFPIPLHGSDGPNYRFICRAHAYAIDSFVAKNLLSYVIQHGICASLDMMIRSDIFPIHQPGLFAYDESDIQNTTITGRPDNGRSIFRNEKL